MSVPRPAERLTIYLSQTEHRGHTPAYVELVEKARESGLAGATLLQGVEGFGDSAQVHHRHLLRFSENVPVVLTIIDSSEKIDRFMDAIKPLLHEGSHVTRHPVTIVIERDGGDRPDRTKR